MDTSAKNNICFYLSTYLVAMATTISCNIASFDTFSFYLSKYYMLYNVKVARKYQHFDLKISCHFQ